MYHSDYWFNLKGMWTNWPIREVNGLFKWYYLTQFAFWLQQILVVNIEERRKDYAQYLVHHIITCALMFMSYGFYHMRVGNVILCCMDVVDIILSVCRCLVQAIAPIYRVADKNRPPKCSNISASAPSAIMLSVSSWLSG
jgi:acyl-CoA-dependent ceramide synthase